MVKSTLCFDDKIRLKEYMKSLREEYSMEKYRDYIRGMEYRFHAKIKLISNPTQHIEEIKIQ